MLKIICLNRNWNWRREFANWCVRFDQGSKPFRAARAFKAYASSALNSSSSVVSAFLFRMGHQGNLKMPSR